MNKRDMESVVDWKDIYVECIIYLILRLQIVIVIIWFTH